MEDVELDGGTRNRILIDSLISEGQARRQELEAIGGKARENHNLGFRQRQILPELISHALSSFDLLADGWKRNELFCMGAAARSLYETRLFATFVVDSETNAVRFYQDGMTDIRDIFESLGSIAADLKSPEFHLLIDQLRKELAGLMAEDGTPHSLKFLKVEKVAVKVGLKAEHDRQYQFLSKFSHASSVTVLTRGGDNWKQFIAPLLCWIGVVQYLHMFASIIDAMDDKKPEGV